MDWNKIILLCCIPANCWK